jgi:hypothetical protein
MRVLSEKGKKIKLRGRARSFFCPHYQVTHLTSRLLVCFVVPHHRFVSILYIILHNASIHPTHTCLFFILYSQTD